jgi:hypothetical protein
MGIWQPFALGILEARLNVRSLQVRIFFQNRLVSHPVGQQVQHQRRRDAHSSDAGLSTHYQGIESNSLDR